MLDHNIILKKDDLTLRPLEVSHFTALAKLAEERKIWEFAPEPYEKPEIFKKIWFEKALDQMQKKERLCFVLFQGDVMAGSSSYYEIDEENKKLRIGYTWFHPAFWGAKINPLSKLALMDFAFETLQYNRVSYSVDSRNIRSCAALKRLGIKHEGVLRNDLVLPNGIIRNSEIFSVIREEWQDVKKGIENRVKSL